jgi:excisionase family DNA binding protein
MTTRLEFERKFYSVDETASMLGCTSVTIRRWVGNGTLPSIKLGGRRLISVDTVNSLIQQAQSKELKAS